MLAASAGVAPPSRRPTNCTGSVTRPDAAGLVDRGREAGVDRAADRGAQRVAGAVAEAEARLDLGVGAVELLSRRRPVRLVAAIAPPIRMPAVGTAARGEKSNAPTASRKPVAMRAGTAIAANAYRRAFGIPPIAGRP